MSNSTALQNLYQQLQDRSSNGLRSLALLLDPDKLEPGKKLLSTLRLAEQVGITWLLFGGSLLTGTRYNKALTFIKENCSLPVVLFPSHASHISSEADGILFLSLISGRNPELLIGQQVVSAPAVKESGIEVLPTGYMLIESGKSNTAIYMSNTQPIPSDKPEIASCTALAGEMLGLRLIYLDGGSGAARPVSEDVVKRVRAAVEAPLIVGGGIRSAQTAEALYQAGADMLVVGNAVEEDADFLLDLAATLKAGDEISRNIQS